MAIDKPKFKPRFKYCWKTEYWKLPCKDSYNFVNPKTGITFGVVSQHLNRDPTRSMFKLT